MHVSTKCRRRDGPARLAPSSPAVAERNTGSLVVVLAVLTLALLLLGVTAPGAVPARADAKTVTVGIYENPPKVFTSESGTPSGIFVDVIEDIAKSEGWTLRYLSGTWAEGLDRLAAGEIDLMPDVAYTADRESMYSFHEVSVLSSWSQVYARVGSGIQSLLDLNGKRVAVLERSIQEETFAQIAAGFQLTINLIAVPDFGTMFQMVADGEADAAITNRFYGITHAKKSGLEDTAIVFDPTELFFAATAGDPKQLLGAIDKRLVSMKSNPESVYYSSLKKWTSEVVKFRLPGWVLNVGIVVGVVLLTTLIASLVLKDQVDARTRELRQVNREMEQRITDRTAELRAAMKRAQEADHLKSAFLATMSHELRTPLNSIIGFTGIMLQGLAGPLNEEQRKQMTMVQNSSRHLLALINDVLDISKIEAGQLELSVTSFDLRASVEKVVKTVSPLAEAKGIDVRVDIEDDVGAVVTDQRRLEQVILNLLNNALKFTEKGYVKVTCRGEADQYLLSFSDTGIGMRPEEIPGLFRPFHQIDASLTRRHEGTGLGLSICRRIVDAMGGSILVESQWGVGSTFAVRLPREVESPA
jgi:signal transduction histidine kinase/ABC-type amino acid transport substrate-binding protein